MEWMPATFKELPRQIRWHITWQAVASFPRVRLWMEVITKRKDVVLYRLLSKQIGKYPERTIPSLAGLSWQDGCCMSIWSNVKTNIGDDCGCLAVQAGQLLSAKHRVLWWCEAASPVTLPLTGCKDAVNCFLHLFVWITHLCLSPDDTMDMLNKILIHHIQVWRK